MSARFWDATGEPGYVALLASDDEDLLIRFADWLDQNKVGWSFVYETETGWDAVSTDYILDPNVAMLLKLTFGGR